LTQRLWFKPAGAQSSVPQSCLFARTLQRGMRGERIRYKIEHLGGEKKNKTEKENRNKNAVIYTYMRICLYI